MPYEFYKTLHAISTVMVIMGLAGAAAVTVNGVARASNKFRLTLAITHGLGMLIALVAGFGLMARLGMMGQGWPLWISLKLSIWVILGGLIALIYRVPSTAKWVWWVVLALYGVAAYLARFKIA